jgi:predicted thioesterase
LDLVGEGKHERFIINVPRFREKFDQKVQKLNKLNK